MYSKLIHGNCEIELKNIESESVDCVITDPPFGISGNPKKRSNSIRKFVYGEWDLSADVNMAFVEIMRVLKKNGSMYVFCGEQQLSDFIMWMQYCGMSSKALVWIRKNPSPVNGEYIWLTAAQLIAFGRYPGATFNEHCKPGVWYESPPVGRNRIHPTQKPESIIADFIRASTNEGDTILDPYMGSGTTGAIAKQLNRNYIGIEIDEAYYKGAEQRIASAPIQPNLL